MRSEYRLYGTRFSFFKEYVTPLHDLDRLKERNDDVSALQVDQYYELPKNEGDTRYSTLVCFVDLCIEDIRWIDATEGLPIAPPFWGA